jgi:hypothetical protein
MTVCRHYRLSSVLSESSLLAAAAAASSAEPGMALVITHAKGKQKENLNLIALIAVIVHEVLHP